MDSGREVTRYKSARSPAGGAQISAHLPYIRQFIHLSVRIKVSLLNIPDKRDRTYGKLQTGSLKFGGVGYRDSKTQ
jgi:hypothetical protein